jgi:hypothetical protein
VEICRFTTSWGGVVRCGEPAFREGFCRFHFECYARGEITERGLISERLDDQERRRAINFHAIRTGSGSRTA